MPFATVNNEKIFYADAGTTGAPAVFIHGAGSNHRIWGNQLRAVSAVARAFALDLPGHGKSEGAGRDTIDAYRDVIRDFLDARELDRAVLVGHSMGGAIVQAFALAYPDRVAGIVLVGTGARLRVLPAILDGVLNDFDATARLVTENCFGANPDPVLLAKSEAEFRACPARVTYGDYSACNGFDILARVAEIRVPTIAICGTHDKMTPVKYSEFLISKIAGARLAVIQDAGHYVMIEKPVETNHALVEFLKNEIR
ncbi:MAG: alpha/beta hydrolase [Chloroflexi bacterium]|nr:alpha/beta hydrolase [Chloroflexota bacterium]